MTHTKPLAFLLALSLLCAVLAPGAALAADPAAYSGTFAIPGSVSGDFSFDFSALTEQAPDRYHSEIARLAILLSIDAYGSTARDGTAVSLNGGRGALLSQLGFENVETVDYTTMKLAEDPYDAVCFHLARRELTVNGKPCAVYAIAIQGTIDANGWTSNFDVGADTSDYALLTGKHPLWKNRHEHKGFSVAAERVLQSFAEYRERFAAADAGRQVSVLATGHSRGAAVANIVGRALEESPLRSYTYTFATPSTTTAANAASYRTIFNIINSDDVVPELPLELWGFRRYGTDIVRSVTDSCKSVYETATGRSYLARKVVSASSEQGFGRVAPTREALYRIEPERYTLQSKMMTSLLSGKMTPLAEVLQNSELYRFCAFDGAPDENGKQGLYICPAFYMQGLANIVGGDLLGSSTAVLTSISLQNSAADSSGIGKYATALNYVLGGISSLMYGHDTAAYYALAATVTEASVPPRASATARPTATPTPAPTPRATVPAVITSPPQISIAPTPVESAEPTSAPSATLAPTEEPSPAAPTPSLTPPAEDPAKPRGASLRLILIGVAVVAAVGVAVYCFRRKKS